MLHRECWAKVKPAPWLQDLSEPWRHPVQEDLLVGTLWAGFPSLCDLEAEHLLGP